MFLTIRLRYLLFPIILGIVVLSVVLILVLAPVDDASPVLADADANAQTLIIDAGHGGEDGGCTSPNGLTESEVNLEIALKMQALAGLFGIEPVMTRDSETIDYPESATSTSQRKVYDQKTRVELINSYQNAVLISIHQNNYPHPSPHGSQALYSNTDESKRLGELIHHSLISALNSENRRVAAPVSDSIYLMKSVECTAVLVECGFFSNAEEESLLSTSEYRMKLAAVLLSSYLQF